MQRPRGARTADRRGLSTRCSRNRTSARFVYGTTQYFEVAAQQAATVGSPFLIAQGAPEVHDYTGVITVSGRRNGIIYFSAPRGMLTVLLMKMNESNVTHDNLRDLVGEVANTISGNVRRDFGKDFVISVPTVVSGHAQSIELPPGCRPVVIPINWHSHAAKLVVCLNWLAADSCPLAICTGRRAPNAHCTAAGTR